MFIFKINTLLKKLLTIILLILFTYQLSESFSWVSTRLFPSPTESSSAWIQKNIPNNANIGVELVPIFQSLPDLLLKDYYWTIYFPKYKPKFTYTVIEKDTKIYPEYVVLSNSEGKEGYMSENFAVNGQKSVVLSHLNKLGYKKIAIFKPNFFLYNLFNGEMNFFNGLEAMPHSITVYQKT